MRGGKWDGSVRKQKERGACHGGVDRQDKGGDQNSRIQKSVKASVKEVDKGGQVGS